MFTEGAVVYPLPGLMMLMATRLPSFATIASAVAVVPLGGGSMVTVGTFERLLPWLMTSMRLTLPAVIDELTLLELMYFSDPTPSE
jgi:hypothetical protein